MLVAPPHTSGQAYLYCATLSQLFHETAWLYSRPNGLSRSISTRARHWPRFRCPNCARMAVSRHPAIDNPSQDDNNLQPSSEARKTIGRTILVANV